MLRANAKVTTIFAGKPLAVYRLGMLEKSTRRLLPGTVRKLHQIGAGAKQN